MKLKMTSLLITGALMGAAMMPVQANNDAMLSLLKVLRDKGTISAQDYELLANAAKADKEAIDTAQAEVKEATAHMPKITTKGKLKIAGDGWTFQPIGRVMWDAINVDNDDLHADDDGEGTELRRARLGFVGTIGDHWGYKFEGDFAKGGTSIKDAFVSYGTKFGDNKFGLKLGQSHIAYGFNIAASSKYMSFMERPLFSDTLMSAGRESGVAAQISANDYHWIVKSTLSNGTLSSGHTDGEDTTTFAIRGSFVPFMQDKKHMLQVGAAYMNQSSGDKSASFKVKQRLVSHLGPKDIDTATDNYEGSNAFTVDALGIYGPFHFLAAYSDLTAESKTNSDQDYTAYSVEAGYFLTGESVKWKKGYTSGITPKGEYGAWQLVARYENIELEGFNGTSIFTEDEADKFTLGVNYYPTQNTRLMFNYDKITDLTIDGVSRDEEPSAFKFRAQAYW